MYRKTAVRPFIANYVSHMNMLLVFDVLPVSSI